MKLKNFIASSFLIVTLALMISCEEVKDPENKPFYEEYKDFIVSNTYKVDNGASYIVIDNIASLNAILQPNDHIDSPKVILESDFRDNIAIAVIKKYNNVCGVNMKIDTVVFSNDRIRFFYDNDVNYGDVANGITCSMFAKPTLVILTNKKDYTSIDFYENGDLIKTINK